MAPKKPAGKPPPPKVDLLKAAGGKPPPKKKIPPPPACFNMEEIMKFKQLFKEFDTQGIDQVTLKDIPIMLRKLGFNPKPAEVQELFRLFLEDDMVETVELHEWYKMVEAKKNWGDDVERTVQLAMAFLGHDDEENPTNIIKLDTLKEELMNWGDEPIVEKEMVDWYKVALKEKTYVFETGDFEYVKFLEIMNSKDVRFNPEPINYFKLDPKQLAALAKEKAREEREIARQKHAEKKARELARRQRMIEAGLMKLDDLGNLPEIKDFEEPPDPYEILRNYW